MTISKALFTVLFLHQAMIGTAQAEIPFESSSQNHSPFADGTIQGKPATHTLVGQIDVYSVLLGKAKTYNQAKADCAEIKAGNVSWSLPTILTTLGLAMAGGGQTIVAMSPDGSTRELYFWTKGENAEEQLILDGSRKIAMIGSEASSRLLDLNEIEKEISDAIDREEDISAKNQMLEGLEKLKEGFPVVCVSSNLKMD